MDRAVILFGQGAHDASRDTARILAVHALDLDKGGYQLIPFVKLARVITIYHGVGPSRWPALAFKDEKVIKGQIGCGQDVDLVTGLLALTTANADAEIHQAAIWVWGGGSGVTAGLGTFLATSKDGSKNGSRCPKKSASVDLHEVTPLDEAFRANPSGHSRLTENLKPPQAKESSCSVRPPETISLCDYMCQTSKINRLFLKTFIEIKLQNKR